MRLSAGLWLDAAADFPTFNNRYRDTADGGHANLIGSLGCAPCKGGAFQWVKAPPGELLQPEATGATMEVTKWLKPSDKRVTKYGDSASVQAVT